MSGHKPFESVELSQGKQNPTEIPSLLWLLLQGFGKPPHQLTLHHHQEYEVDFHLKFDVILLNPPLLVHQAAGKGTFVLHQLSLRWQQATRGTWNATQVENKNNFLTGNSSSMPKDTKFTFQRKAVENLWTQSPSRFHTPTLRLKEQSTFQKVRNIARKKISAIKFVWKACSKLNHL